MTTYARLATPIALVAALAAFLAPPARALGDGDGFIATLWGEPSLGDLDESVRLAADSGARHVTFLVFLTQDGPRASSVRFANTADGTPFDGTPMAAKMRHAIANARSRGLSAGLIPFPMEPGHSRRHFWNPDDRAAWFQSYGARLRDLARFAEREGADELIAGSELSLLFQDSRGWRGVISGIRGEFSGHVTISSTFPDYGFIRFWDACDSVGVSAYFPLAVFPWTTSASAFERAWRLHRAHLATVARAYRKPLTFVEVGYPATNAAATQPWNFDWSRPLEHGRQALCFEAFRRVWSRDPLLRRFEIWGLSPIAVDRRDTGGKGFLPLGKPAEAPVRQLFAERAR